MQMYFLSDLFRYLAKLVKSGRLVLTGLFPLRTRFTCYGHQTGDWKIDQFPHGNHCFNSYENAFPGKNKKAAFFTEAAFRIYGISLLLLNQCSEFAVSCIFCKFQVDSSFFSHSLISSDSSFQVADNCVSVVCTSSYDSFQVRSCSVGFSNCVQSL